MIDVNYFCRQERLSLIHTTGSRQMARWLRRRHYRVGRKRVQRLMRVIGLSAIYQKPNTSRPHPQHRIYPYLLRHLRVERANQVWCADITYIPARRARDTQSVTGD